MRTNRQEGIRDPDPVVAYLCVFVALLLTGGEQVAIAAAGGVKDFTWRHIWTDPLVSGSSLLGGALTMSIIIVFLLPAHEAVMATLSPDLTNHQRNVRSLAWAAAFGVVGYVLPVVL